MKVPDIFNKIINWKKKEENIASMANKYQEQPIEGLEVKSTADESRDEIHKALDAVINIKDHPKPIPLQRERIDAIKSNIISKSQIAKAPHKKSEGKNEIINKIKDKVKVNDIECKQKVQRGYIKHYSGYFSNLKSGQLEIKPRAISKITAYKSNILKHLKEAYKNEQE